MLLFLCGRKKFLGWYGRGAKGGKRWCPCYCRSWKNSHAYIKKSYYLPSFIVPFRAQPCISSFHILPVLFCGPPEQQIQQFCKFSFFFITIRSGLLIIIIRKEFWLTCHGKLETYSTHVKNVSKKIKNSKPSILDHMKICRKQLDIW